MALEKVTVRWGDEKADIPADMVFTVVDAVEQFLTVGELAAMRTNPARIRYAKLAQAYAAVLFSVGIRVTPQEVRAEFTKALKSAGTAREKLDLALQVVDSLLLLLTDGAPEPDDGEEDLGKKLPDEVSDEGN